MLSRITKVIKQYTNNAKTFNPIKTAHRRPEKQNEKLFGPLWEDSDAGKTTRYTLAASLVLIFFVNTYFNVLPHLREHWNNNAPKQVEEEEIDCTDLVQCMLTPGKDCTQLKEQFKKCVPYAQRIVELKQINKQKL